MEKNKTNTLGGFEAIIDTFIPKVQTEEEIEINDVQDPLSDEELENIKKTSVDPVAEQVKSKTNKQEKQEEEEEIEEPQKQESDDKKTKTEVENVVEKNIEEPSGLDNEEQVVSGFFEAMAEKLGWDIDEDEEKPSNVESLIEYFQKIIEEESKPAYSSKEIEDLDNFVKRGGNLRDYFQIDAEINLDEIDMDNEDNQKIIIREFLKEKGFSTARIDKQISKYEDAGLLEDEAQDALEDLKEIKQQKKEQLLQEQKKAYEQYRQQQQAFYENVVGEIKGLKNIRGIAIPEKDKKDLIDYIFKPDSDGKTKYQKDYSKDGIKNLIESAYFTKNADRLIAAAKREGSNSAIDKFKKSLKSTTVNTKSKQTYRNSEDDTIWDSFTKKLRISNRI